MNQDILAERLKEYQKRAIEWRAIIKNTRFNKEQNTTVKFVIPLLEALGWRGLSDEVEFEYYIKNGGRADIALYHNKIPTILVEVKPIQDDLDSAGKQMFKQYLKNCNVKYGIVTNGRELILFDKFRVTSKAQKGRPLFTLRSVDDFIEYKDVLSVLSKEMVASGRLDKLAGAYHRKEYWEWKNRSKTGNKEYDEHVLPLKFARSILKI